MLLPKRFNDIDAVLLLYAHFLGRWGKGKCCLQARGNVEAWLGQVEQSMAVCLRKLARAGYQTYPNQARTQWVTQQPSQLVLLISQVQFADSPPEAQYQQHALG